MFDFGFVIPLYAEARPLLAKLKNRQIKTTASRKVYTGFFQKREISLIVCGCGKIKSASATQYLIDNYSAKVYCHFGTAGAISDKLRIGDIVIADRGIEHDVIELFPKKVPPPTHRISTSGLMAHLKNYNHSTLIRGSILSGDEDVITTERKRELYRSYKSLAVDWESAGFALTCQLNKVKGYILRGISDYAYEHTASEYKKNQKLVMKNMMELLSCIFNKNFGLNQTAGAGK